MQFIGEIRMFAGSFAPADWALCDGRLLQIAEYDALFALIGSTYGGDGETTFGVPDLRGRLPVHRGTGTGGDHYDLGQAGGQETVRLRTTQVPSHRHTMLGTSDDADKTDPSGHVLAFPEHARLYNSRPPTVPMSPEALTPYQGGGRPHDNMQPYLPISFIIALAGLWPMQS